MENRNLSRLMSLNTSDVALECVMGYIDDPEDRDAISQVCRKWYQVDTRTRKHVTIALCYSTSPDHLRRRFPWLESLKLKGKPRPSMFNLLPEDWGGYAGPWINEIAKAFECLKSVHFRRMIVQDADIEVLVRARSHMLLSLKLDKCSGFSTDALRQVARSCRCLKTLFLEKSAIIENDGEWLSELAVNNTVLETLNFFETKLSAISWQDLELIARNCKSLISLKISHGDIQDLAGFFRAATALEEFGGGSLIVNGDDQSVSLPPRLSSWGLFCIETDAMQIIFPYAANLKNLDLQSTFLDTEDHCQLIQQCPNLEVLKVRNEIGDRGLETVARRCKRLRRLHVEIGRGMVTQRGLSALAQGCLELEYLAVHVSDITNAALESVGTFSKNLCDFRLVLLDREERITELPLDNGVRALLRGCTKLRRFALYLRRGGLTDVGLGYIGELSRNVRWMLLGCVGESDRGLLELSRGGCPNLQTLELRACCFSLRTLALAVMQMTSLRYICVQGFNASVDDCKRELLVMAGSFWNIEFIPPRQVITFPNQGGEEQPAQIIAYRSLAGQRTDHPETVVPLFPG